MGKMNMKKILMILVAVIGFGVCANAQDVYNVSKVKASLNNSSFVGEGETIVLVDNKHFEIYSGGDEIEAPLTHKGTYEIYKDSYGNIVLNLVNYSMYFIKYEKTNYYNFYILEKYGNSSKKYHSPNHYNYR